MNFEPAKDVYQPRSNSKNDPRIGEQLKDIESASHVLYGYPDDTGIALNGGRLGARLGPNQARKHLYKMTQNPFITEEISLHDLGNLKLNNNIEDHHKRAQQNAEGQLSRGKKVISIGGGHDYGYPDAAAFLKHCQSNSLKRPMVINIDAHLDVRPTDNGLSSGTPFFRLLEEFTEFDFYEIGIQPQCNAKGHVDWCLKKGGQILTYDEIIASGQSFTEVVNQFLGDSLVKPRPCFLSVDIDAFSSSFAMGCSQAWPTGLQPESFFQWFEVIKHRSLLLGLGVYELSPPLDLDDRTSKLVAQIIYRFLQ